MVGKRILIVEDEATLGRVLSDTLRSHGYEVTLAEDGIAGIELFTAQHADLVIADIMMPHMDGLSMVEEIRKMDSRVEVLFLSARSAAEDVVEGFRRGGNDYLRKPFSLDELLARIAALLSRHPEGDETTIINIGHYRLNSRLWTLSLEGSTRRLTARESAILVVLAQHRGEIVTTTELLNEFWGDDSYYNLRSLNVFISRLRSYLRDDKRIEIQSVRNTGYRMVISDKAPHEE